MHRTELTPSGTATRRAAVTALVGLDAIVVLLGTAFVWILLGLAEFDREVPGWVTPTAVAVGVTTAGLTGYVALHRLRGTPNRPVALLAALLHGGLAACAAVALGSVTATLVLLVGAAVAAAGGGHRMAR